MPALLVNIRIDSEEKLEFFKVTFADIAALFDEWHVKVRGKRGQECMDFARRCAGSTLRDYQALQQEDWVAATLEMVRQVKARSVFIYFEDHRLVAKRDDLQRTLRAFDESGLDYLCYSFFQASQLEARNLLPLAPKAHAEFDSFALDARTRDLVGRISPNYYTFSLLSVASVEYFTAMLASENHRRKVYSRLLLAVLTRAFRYPAYRKAYAWLNSLVAPLGFALTIYEPSSPFNLEKLWHESVLGPRGWKFGIPKRELFANYDDDNGAYGESLIKRGLYPLSDSELNAPEITARGSANHKIRLAAGETYDCTYVGHCARIRHAPIVKVSVIDGDIQVTYKGSETPIGCGGQGLFFSNFQPFIRCLNDAEIQIHVYDEQFRLD